MTTSKPLKTMEWPITKTRKRIVIEKTDAAYILACLLETWGNVTSKSEHFMQT